MSDPRWVIHIDGDEWSTSLLRAPTPEQAIAEAVSGWTVSALARGGGHVSAAPVGKAKPYTVRIDGDQVIVETPTPE